jgi:glutamate decarboxylase
MSASPVLTLAEEACVRELARLCGWISEAGSSGSGSSQADLIDGLTMPGGSAANTLALQTALQARFPLYKEDGCLGILEGLASDSESKGQTPEYRGVAVLTSSQGHYS